MSQPDFAADFRKLIELFGPIESFDREVGQRWPKVLADSQNVYARCVNLPHEFYQFIFRFAQTDHKSGFHHWSWAIIGHIPQHVQRAVEFCRPANSLVQSADQW